MQSAASSDISKISQVAFLVLDNDIGLGEFGANW